MPEQHEIINDLFDDIHQRFYEKAEFGICSLCGHYDKLVKGEDWCYSCQDAFENEENDDRD